MTDNIDIGGIFISYIIIKVSNIEYIRQFLYIGQLFNYKTKLTKNIKLIMKLLRTS